MSINCENCGQRLGERRGNTLIASGFVLEFKRSHNIECGGCGTYTTFDVSREQKRFDNRAIKTDTSK